MTEPEALAVDLVRAGRSLAIDPVPDDLAERVLAAIPAAPPVRRGRALLGWGWLRAHRRRWVAAVITAVIIALALTSPVRAAVIEWLRVGGVVVKTGAPPVATPTPAPPTGDQVMNLAQARASVGFAIGVPAQLGAPDKITVSADRRVVGMDWTVDGREVHLDQFDGSMSWAFVKQHWTEVTPTQIGGQDAVWLPDAHEIVYVDRDGVERPETARISGPCLVWQPTLDQRGTTARLEGIPRLATARAIAESLH